MDIWRHIIRVPPLLTIYYLLHNESHRIASHIHSTKINKSFGCIFDIKRNLSLFFTLSPFLRHFSVDWKMPIWAPCALMLHFSRLFFSIVKKNEENSYSTGKHDRENDTRTSNHIYEAPLGCSCARLNRWERKKKRKMCLK